MSGDRLNPPGPAVRPPRSCAPPSSDACGADPVAPTARDARPSSPPPAIPLACRPT
ncbi:hypothetical protein ACFPM0_34165 [Pseudonocardia sulfidoxydans]|uniref:hypothetical protein n=1 Tax=Pseudonocardia sulfidoxydans TaxID=54011 RepID=UPI00361D3A52